MSITTDRVTIEKGEWRISLPVDRRARMPNYDELLTRLRRPIARFTLAEEDAKLWVQDLSSQPSTASVVLSFANPPSIRFDDHPRTTMLAKATAYVSQQTMQVNCAPDRLRQALKLGFHTLTTAGVGQPLLALDGPRRFVLATHDNSDKR